MKEYFYLIEKIKKLLKHLNFSNIEVIYDSDNLGSSKQKYGLDRRNTPQVVAIKNETSYYFEIVDEHLIQTLKNKDSVPQPENRYNGKDGSCYVIVTPYGSKEAIQDLYKENELPDVEFWEL